MDLDTFDTLVRGMGVGIALLIAAQMASNIRKSSYCIYGMLFALGIAAYLACAARWFSGLPILISAPIMLFCIFNALLFWLFSQAAFNDQFQLGRNQLIICAAFALVQLLKLVVWLLPLPEFSKLSVVLHQVAAIALILHILFEIIQGRSNDLVESRRVLRNYVVLISGAYMMLVVTAELVLLGSQAPLWLESANAVGITGICFGIAMFAVQIQDGWLSNEMTAVNTVQPLKAETQEAYEEHAALIERILLLFKEENYYRDESLTVVSLAEKLSVPEYMLRRAINQGMGYKNFNSSLNRHRLAEVEIALADPSRMKRPILGIAYDAGFNSLAPFSKAFKEKTGMTPSAFRALRKNESE